MIPKFGNFGMYSKLKVAKVLLVLISKFSGYVKELIQDILLKQEYHIFF